MDWLAQNWIWILFAVAFFAIQFVGHRGHGGHGGHGGGCCGGGGDEESSDRREDRPRASHQH